MEEERRVYLQEHSAQATQTAVLAKEELDALTSVTQRAMHAAITEICGEEKSKHQRSALQQATYAGALVDDSIELRPVCQVVCGVER